MDAWSHFVFTYAIAILLGIGPYDKLKKFTIFCVLIEFLNLILASLSLDYYNEIGVVLRGPSIGYLIYLRSKSTEAIEKSSFENLIILLYGGVYLGAASHNLDLVIEQANYLVIGDSMYRGHNVWHTPFIAMTMSLLVVLIIYTINGYFEQKSSEKYVESSFNLLYISLLVGYLTHILADFLVFDFPIFWLFPLSSFTLSIVDIINQGILTQEGTPSKPEGTTYYWGAPFFVSIFLIFILLRQSYQNKLKPK